MLCQKMPTGLDLAQSFDNSVTMLSPDCAQKTGQTTWRCGRRL